MLFSCAKEENKTIPAEFDVLKDGKSILDNNTVIESDKKVNLIHQTDS